MKKVELVKNEHGSFDFKCGDVVITTTNCIDSWAFWDNLEEAANKAKFRIESLYRIKCGLYPNIGYAKKNDWHVDRPDDHYVGLYYVNSSDGPTDFRDQSVECVANRFVLFDGSLFHRSTHPTDVKGRINININMRGYFLK